MEKQNITPTVQRIMQVLDLVITSPGGVGLRDFNEKLEISRSTLFLILNSLKSLGYLDQSEKRGKYFTGARLAAWKVGNTGGNNPGMDLLSSFFQETENDSMSETLAIVVRGNPGEVVVLGQSESVMDVRVVFSSGQHLPSKSAAGAILSGRVAEEFMKIGYARIKRGEVEDIAVPVCTDGINPDAALLYSFPAYRSGSLNAEEIYHQLQEMAARISYRCGALVYNPWQDAIHHEAGETINMTDDQIEGLLKAPWMARMACVKPDGSPHVVPVWFEWSRQKVHILAWKGSKWAEYLALNPQISLTIDEPWKPFRRISINGVAAVIRDPSRDQTDLLVSRIGNRYLGPKFSQTLLAQIECAFSVTISSLKGWQGI